MACEGLFWTFQILINFFVLKADTNVEPSTSTDAAMRESTASKKKKPNPNFSGKTPDATGSKTEPEKENQKNKNQKQKK